MNLFVGILGMLVIAAAVLLGGIKFVENDKLKKKLEKKKITEEEYRRSSKRYVGNVAGVICGVSLVVFSFSFVIIPTGYSGVKTTFGQVSQNTMPNGFNFKLPFVQKVEKVNNKQQDIIFSKNKISSETSERNTVIFSGITVTYQINPEKSAWIFANVSDYENNLVSESLVASAIKTSSKLLTPTDVTNRSILEPKAQENIQKSLDEKYGAGVIQVNKVVINGAEFDKEYDDKIAKKQQAQMDYEKQQIENKKNIEKAEADAKVKKRRRRQKQTPLGLQLKQKQTKK